MSNPKQNTQKQAAPPAQEQAKKTLPTEITARAYPVAGDGPVLANLTLDVNGCFAIRGAKLVQGKNGPFVSMPQRQTRDGYQEVVFPITREMRETLNGMALDAYQQALALNRDPRTPANWGFREAAVNCAIAARDFGAARSAIGVGSLPTNASVEVEIIAERL